ncbi:transposase [Pectinatus frisingensis]|uniref:transposase n=1 Tax=Pectinatus frisingensis TaxID=865 RepID=UPI001E6562B4|nr:transposase [Pectinatus frisingensis]
MYLMEHETPSYRTFGYFIETMLKPSVEELFSEINNKIFAKDHVDLSHLYIDGSKFEANANKYSWVWKKATEKSRYRLFEKVTELLDEINDDLVSFGIKIDTNSEYVPEYLDEITDRYAKIYEIDETKFVHGKGNRYGRQEEVYQCKNCTDCPYAAECKKMDKNRTIRLNQELTSMHQEVVNNLENIQGALFRMNHSIQSEGTFGIIKNNRWYKRIVRKGMEQVRLEIFLVSIGYNLYKYYNKRLRIKKAA